MTFSTWAPVLTHDVALIRGFGVRAVEVDVRRSDGLASSPIVADYDGKNLPVPDRAFGVVFSGNVLERVENLATFRSADREVVDTWPLQRFYMADNCCSQRQSERGVG